MKVEYFANRDAVQARSDEDAAMAHARIYFGDDLAEAREALYAYMVKEVMWLTDRRYVSPLSLRRAADILEAADKVWSLEPESGKAWSEASVISQTGKSVGLVWQIVRTER